MGYRTERDSLGEVKVPEEAYWGAQTERARRNFAISGERPHPLLVHAYVLVKKAACKAHLELGNMDPDIGTAIIEAADGVLSGELSGHFVVDTFQAGAGTSFNMNVNEVLANRALEIMGRERGQYKFVCPNDHVNKGQSTNDTFPTAANLAVLFSVRKLGEAGERLAAAFQEKARSFPKL